MSARTVGGGVVALPLLGSEQYWAVDIDGDGNDEAFVFNGLQIGVLKWEGRPIGRKARTAWWAAGSQDGAYLVMAGDKFQTARVTDPSGILHNGVFVTQTAPTNTFYLLEWNGSALSCVWSSAFLNCVLSAKSFVFGRVT